MIISIMTNRFWQSLREQLSVRPDSPASDAPLRRTDTAETGGEHATSCWFVVDVGQSGCDADQLGTHVPEPSSNRLIRRLGRGVFGTIAADVLATYGAIPRVHEKCLEAFGGRPF